MVADIRGELQSHQADLIARIATAAKAADASRLLSLNDELRQTVSLLSRLQDLSVEVQGVLRGTQAQVNAQQTASGTAALPESVAGRGHGVQIRSGFLARSLNAGLRLRPHRGAIYASPSGRRVGIAVATERKPNRWFLGLGEDDFDAAVLLCAQNSGKVLDICLPASFILKHRQDFSRSGGQIKFNVAHRDGRLILKVPGRTPEPIDQFVAAVAGLDQ